MKSNNRQRNIEVTRITVKNTSLSIFDLDPKKQHEVGILDKRHGNTKLVDSTDTDLIKIKRRNITNKKPLPGLVIQARRTIKQKLKSPTCT